MWPQYWGLYEPRGPAKGPKGVKSHPTKKKLNPGHSSGKPATVLLEYSWVVLLGGKKG
jgi:hypothetical protein